MFFPPVFPLVLCSGLSSDNVIKCAGHTASARFTRNQNNNKPTSSKQSNFENPDVCGRDFVFLPDRIKKNKKLDCSNQSTRFPLQRATKVNIKNIVCLLGEKLQTDGYV